MSDINYDEALQEEAITITLKSKEYVIQPPTVEQLIAYEKQVKVLSTVKNEWAKVSEQMKKIIMTIYTSVPLEALDYPHAILKKMMNDVSGLITIGKSGTVAEGKKKLTPAS